MEEEKQRKVNLAIIIGIMVIFFAVMITAMRYAFK